MKTTIKSLHGTEQETLSSPPLIPLNNNILICGTSGSGKTVLLRELEKIQPPKLKLIFKSDGEKSLSVSKNRPFIQEDRTNFLDAWRESNTADNQGYMLLQEQVLMEKLREKGDTLQELRRKVKNELERAKDIDKAILGTISHKLNFLYPVAPLETITGAKLNMEGLSEMEYQFFSDYILRQRYQEITQEFISIDEIHRLQPLMKGLLTRITREIMSRGGLLATSQSISDLPPEMVNNFGTIFSFQTIDSRDLRFLEQLSQKLKENVLLLEPHEFIEIRSFRTLEREGHNFKMELRE